MCNFDSYMNRLKMHDETPSRRKVDDDVQDGAVPAYLLDREQTTRAKVGLLFSFLSRRFPFAQQVFKT